MHFLMITVVSKLLNPLMTSIRLLSIIGKVLMKVMQLQLQKHREQTSQEEEAGFWPHRGCCNQIFTFHQMIKDRIRCRKWTVIAFIDFKSAFDYIHWPALWEMLEVEHLPRKIIQLLQASYNSSTSCMWIRNKLSNDLSIWTGVRQGDAVSHLLFNIVIDAIMRKARSTLWQASIPDKPNICGWQCHIRR